VAELHLARDLEDKRVLDRNGRELGRVDRVVLAQPRDGMAHVTAIEIGPSALAARLHPVAGRIVRALEHVFRIEDGRPLRLPVERIESVGENVKVDLAAGDTAALAVEQRLRKFVRHFPGPSAK
jgi:sporulation protein YlmC with PRC-barrel domain